MPVVLANFNDPAASGECTAHGHGKAHLSNLRWTQRDSLDNGDDGSDSDTDGTVVIDEVAERIGMCSESDCSACHMAHMSNDVNNRFAVCTENVVMKYSNMCKSH